MRARRSWVVLGAVAAATTIAAAACSLDEEGTSTFTGEDAGFEGAVLDAVVQDDAVGGDQTAPTGDAGSAVDGSDAAPLDATTRRDAALDAQIPGDATASDGAATCTTGFRCDTPAGSFCVADCVACGSQTGAALACASTRRCVATCASCGGAAECWTCGSTGTGTPVGSCDSRCLSGNYAHCTDCKFGGCPGDLQVCEHLGGTTYECRTCGESSTIGGGCSGGGVCAQAQVCR